MLGLLNSTIYKVWFENRGKKKGDMLEFMPTVLNEIPIIDMKDVDIKQISDLSQLIINRGVESVESIISFSEYKMIDEIILKYVNQKDLENE